MVTQDPFGGQLWAFPVMLAPNASGFNLYFPNACGFNPGPALPIVGTVSGSTYTATQSVVTGWSDWGFQFGLPDAAGRRMDITLARGVPFVWTTYTGINPAFNLGTTTIYDTNGNTISLAGNSFTASAFAFNYQGRSFGVFAPGQPTSAGRPRARFRFCSTITRCTRNRIRSSTAAFSRRS